MKYFKTLSLILLASLSTAANSDEYYGKTLKYIYQRDNIDQTEFEFRLTDTESHSCGGTVYLVRSTNLEHANRKFSMVLAAVASGNKIDFGSNGNCLASNRLEVSWIRLTNE